MDSTKTLVTYLKQVPDFRRAEGKRYPLPTLLVMIIMAIMSGRYGYRSIARFMDANRKALITQLGLQRPEMPSHVTVRTILEGIDFGQLNKAFRQWILSHLDREEHADVALDGKAIRSTVSDYDRPYQDFVGLVSAFASRQGVVLDSGQYSNKNSGEAEVGEQVIERLIEVLELQGVTFSMDALYCKKN
jgi:hypothetical protein